MVVVVVVVVGVFDYSPTESLREWYLKKGPLNRRATLGYTEIEMHMEASDSNRWLMQSISCRERLSPSYLGHGELISA